MGATRVAVMVNRIARFAAAVVLVTSDVNLQTKAEIAELPFAEPPPAP